MSNGRAYGTLLTPPASARQFRATRCPPSPTLARVVMKFPERSRAVLPHSRHREIP